VQLIEYGVSLILWQIFFTNEQASMSSITLTLMSSNVSFQYYID
jgi:hypothetical protein